MMDVSARDLGTTIVGEPVGLPVVLAPTGFMGVVYPDGELHAAKAAHAYNVPLCLSVLSVCSLEEDVSTSMFNLFMGRGAWSPAAASRPFISRA
jgi:L-lactate dehydrogenase (cytochrome)